MTYEEALSYLDSLNESRIKPGLERIRQALMILDSPQTRYPHLLVGGTNGKGSVAAMTAAALTRCGYRVGRYTSPHLIRFEERIAVDGVFLTPGELTNLVGLVRESGISLTYFEFATAMALLHYDLSGVDIAVLEVGLGGQWDATNATDPFLSVITNVAIDHENWLGSTLEGIALEKSGIMRTGRPVIHGKMDPGPAEVLRQAALEKGCPLFILGKDFRVSWEASGKGLHYQGVRWDITGVSPGPGGRYQGDNAACALAALEVMAAAGYRVKPEDAGAGIRSARWPGRFQVMNGHPTVIVDAAHNPSAMVALVDSLSQGPPVVWVFSALRDKDLRGMVRCMMALSGQFVLVPLDHPRGRTLVEMVTEMPEGAQVTAAPSVAEGMAQARRLAGDGGRVVAAGSVILAGEVLRVMGREG